MPDRALVVGIDRYPDLGDLRGAEADAKDFHKWVTEEAGVTDATLIVSSNFDPVELWNEKPAQETINNFFRAVNLESKINKAAEKDVRVGRRLYLFFSGHGFAPELDKSGVLMANSASDEPLSFAAMWWANRMYEGGWFDEVLLFQDACRERMSDAELTPPFLRRDMDGKANRRRFYAFSAKDDLLALEKKWGERNRGVFTLTLLAGLRGGARDPQTGEITTKSLREYLEMNMRKLLSRRDLAREDVATEPGVFHPDEFVIVAAPRDWARDKVRKFPVRVSLRGARGARVIDRDLKDVKWRLDGPDPWDIMLPRGLYRVFAEPYSSEEFQVTGALRADGSPEVLNVPVR
jgi:hypothetical protein